MIFPSILITFAVLTAHYQASAMSVKGLFFKRLTGIICDPQNLSIKQAMREQVLAAFNTWQNGPSPNIISVPANQESCLGNSLSVAVGDHYERAALGYVNVGNKDIMVSIKTPDGDSLLKAANEILNQCWSGNTDLASAQFFFGESGNNLIIRTQCSKDQKNWNNNCN